jgi:hypothetical protein
MVEVPNALIEKLNPLGPHFIRVRKRGKEPWDKGWPTQPLSAVDSCLRDWLMQGGNYGVVGGSGLTIVDLDHPDLIRKVKERLPQTLTVQTS